MADKNSASQPGAISGEGDDVSTPQYVTQEQLNQALNGFRKSTKKDFDEIKALFSQREEPETTASKPAKGDKAEDLEKTEMKKQIQILLDRQAKADAEAREVKLHASLRDALVQNGVDARYAEHAIALTKHKNMVRYDDDGNIVMRVNDIDQPLSDAAKAFAKSEDAKIYLAPRDTRGSGQRGSVRAPLTRETPDKRASDFDNLLLQLPEAILK